MCVCVGVGCFACRAFPVATRHLTPPPSHPPLPPFFTLMQAVVILDTTHGSGSSLVRGLGELLSYAMLGLNMGGGGGDSGEDGKQANAAAALGGSAPVDENDLL